MMHRICKLRAQVMQKSFTLQVGTSKSLSVMCTVLNFEKTVFAELLLDRTLIRSMSCKHVTVDAIDYTSQHVFIIKISRQSVVS